MTIDEAIKILYNLSHEGPIPHPQDNIDAHYLGIEALKREKVWRQNDPGGAIHLLPGETEE